MIQGVARLALVAVLIMGCGGGWSKTAGQTTCADWLDKMTTDDRTGLGGALLVVLWNGDGAAQAPPDAKVATFANAIGLMCATTRDATISTVGSYVYLTVSGVKPSD